MKTIYFLKLEGRLFTFCFAPCVPSINSRFTLSVIPSFVFIRFCCHLFVLVATHLPSVPLCFELMPFTSSLLFVQRAAALHLSNAFIDPHAYIYTFLSSLLAFPALESFIWVLPRFSTLFYGVSSSGFEDIPF